MTNMFSDCNTLRSISLGADSVFLSDVYLPLINIATGINTGRWIRISGQNSTELINDNEFNVYSSSSNFTNGYTGSHPGTYVWEKNHNIIFEVDGTVFATRVATTSQRLVSSTISNPTKAGFEFAYWEVKVLDNTYSVPPFATTWAITDRVFNSITLSAVWSDTYEIQGNNVTISETQAAGYINLMSLHPTPSAILASMMGIVAKKISGTTTIEVSVDALCIDQTPVFVATSGIYAIKFANSADNPTTSGVAYITVTNAPRYGTGIGEHPSGGALNADNSYLIEAYDTTISQNRANEILAAPGSSPASIASHLQVAGSSLSSAGALSTQPVELVDINPTLTTVGGVAYDVVYRLVNKPSVQVKVSLYVSDTDVAMIYPGDDLGSPSGVHLDHSPNYSTGTGIEDYLYNMSANNKTIYASEAGTYMTNPNNLALLMDVAARRIASTGAIDYFPATFGGITPALGATGPSMYLVTFNIETHPNITISALLTLANHEYHTTLSEKEMSYTETGNAQNGAYIGANSARISKASAEAILNSGDMNASLLSQVNAKAFQFFANDPLNQWIETTSAITTIAPNFASSPGLYCLNISFANQIGDTNPVVQTYVLVEEDDAQTSIHPEKTRDTSGNSSFTTVFRVSAKNKTIKVAQAEALMVHATSYAGIKELMQVRATSTTSGGVDTNIPVEIVSIRTSFSSAQGVYIVEYKIIGQEVRLFAYLTVSRLDNSVTKPMPTPSGDIPSDEIFFIGANNREITTTQATSLVGNNTGLIPAMLAEATNISSDGAVAPETVEVLSVSPEVGASANTHFIVFSIQSKPNITCGALLTVVAPGGNNNPITEGENTDNQSNDGVGSGKNNNVNGNTNGTIGAKTSKTGSTGNNTIDTNDSVYGNISLENSTDKNDPVGNGTGRIKDNDKPLADEESWSFLSLAMGIFSILISLYVLNRIRRSKKDSYNGGKTLRAIATTLGLGPIFAFVLLDKIGGLVLAINKDTVWIALAFFAHVILSTIALYRVDKPKKVKV
jgi:hypothetical protein